MRFRLRRVFRFKKSFITILVIALAAGLTILIVKSLEAPAVGSVNQAPPDKAEHVDPYAQPGNYNDKFVSFTYPDHYKKIPSSITGQYLDVYSLFSTDQTGKSITLGIQKGSLAETSGYQYRLQHPEFYTQEPRTRTAQTFSSKTIPEKVAFMEHNGLVATVSITSTQNNPNITQDLGTILNSFAWK